MPVYRRCRPCLGTFVEIGLIDESAGGTEIFEAIGRGFAKIEEVSSALSFHDPESALTRLNRSPLGVWAPIPAPLTEVLTLALELQRRTRGRFNVAIGKPLIFWQLLPGRAASPGWRHLSRPGFEVISNSGAGRARRILPVAIDLGGIGKGFAVDRAVESLGSRANGWVNAGGDLRVFGSERHSVWVRAGKQEESRLRLLSLSNEALATSTVQPERGHSAYVNPASGKALIARRTAVARAKSCVIADAFTKIALLLPKRESESLAAEYGAEVSLAP